MRRLVALAVVATVLAVAAPAQAAEAGDMDPSFGGSGTKVVDMGVPDELVRAVHALPSGRLLIGGTYARGYPYGQGDPFDGLVLARLQPWGGLDQTFGSGGRVKVAASKFVWGDSVVQPDGKLLVASTELLDGRGRAVVVRRFTTAGALDRQFGLLGVAVVTVLDASAEAPRLALTSTGAIIVGTDDAASVRVTRLTPSGAIDRSFGSNGVAVSERPADSDNVYLERIFVTASGAIVLATVLNPGCAPRECYWVAGVAQLRADGTPDESFAAGGYTVIPDGGFQVDVALGSGGTVYVAGPRHLFRLAADGASDPTFGSGGSVPLVHAGRVDVAPDGRAVVAGGGYVSRFLLDGSSDPSFGGGDGVATYALANGTPPIDGDVDVQADGKIVVAGTKNPGWTTYDAVLFRLLG